jgi:hypothetical protein
VSSHAVAARPGNRGLPASAARFLLEHHLVASRSELRSLGCTDHRLDALIGDGTLVTPFRGVLAVPFSGDRPATSARAVCLASRHAVVSHASAAQLWGIELHRAPSGLHVSIPAHTHVGLRPAVVHRTHQLGPHDVVCQPDGIRVTSVPRTLFDLASVAPAWVVADAVGDALARGACTAPELWAAARRLCRPGRPGSGTFADILGSDPAWSTPSPPKEHPALVRLAEHLHEAGVAVSLPWTVEVAPGEVAVFALGIPHANVGVQVEFRAWHGGTVPGTARRLLERRLQRRGIAVVAVTDEELHGADGPGVVAGRLHVVLRGRATHHQTDPEPVERPDSLHRSWPCAS